ncbi:hypothetical protein EDB85DRAFT_1958441 [Lactarius pseudohatsudake]|nr:hypothetical protein EDB85DRAFT_1958441 [Lactarius pseudohatsudake]
MVACGRWCSILFQLCATIHWVQLLCAYSCTGSGSQASRKSRSCQRPLDHGLSDTIIVRGYHDIDRKLCFVVSERFISRVTATTIHSPSRSWRCHRSHKFPNESLCRIHFERPFQNCVAMPSSTYFQRSGACCDCWAITEQCVMNYCLLTVGQRSLTTSLLLNIVN